MDASLREVHLRSTRKPTLNRSNRHYHGWQFIPLVLFVLVLVLSETVLVLEEKYRDFVDKRAKHWGYSFPEKVIDLIRFRLFRVRVRVPRR
jgi:hypothetical protein